MSSCRLRWLLSRNGFEQFVHSYGRSPWNLLQLQSSNRGVILKPYRVDPEVSYKLTICTEAQTTITANEITKFQMNGFEMFVVSSFACWNVRTMWTLKPEVKAEFVKFLESYATKSYAFDFSWTSFLCSTMNRFSLKAFLQTGHVTYSEGSISKWVFSCPSRFPFVLSILPQIRQMNFSFGLQDRDVKLQET